MAEEQTEDGSAVWVDYCSDGEDENFLCGSAAGLRALRDHIDQAIEHGVSRIEERGIGLAGIRRKESPPQDETVPPSAKLIGYLCAALFLAVVALAVYGFIALIR